MMEIRRNCQMAVPLLLCPSPWMQEEEAFFLRYSSLSTHSIPITSVRKPYITQCAHLSANCMSVCGNSCAGIRLSVAMSMSASKLNMCRLMCFIYDVLLLLAFRMKGLIQEGVCINPGILRQRPLPSTCLQPLL